MVTVGLWPGYMCVGRAGGVLGGGRLPPSLCSSGRHRPTALARSVAYLTVWGANTNPKKVVALTLPLRFAPLRLLSLSRATSPRAPCYV